MIDKPDDKKPKEPQTDEVGPVPDPFDPNSLRVSGDVNAIGAEKVLIRIAVRKPSKQEFFRVTIDPVYRLPCAILELEDGMSRDFHLVTPAALHLIDEDVRHVELLLCQNRQNVNFFWPLPMPSPDGRTNSWHASARKAANLAEADWIRMVANTSEGGYSVYKATGSIPDPQWPEKTMPELLKLACKDGRLIDSEDHPVIKQLYGG